MKNATPSALVLEGGGMRGIFTAGVLDALLDLGVDFDACYAVSAGAGHACSYLARQRGRARRVNVSYLGDSRYCSFRSLVGTGDLFGAEMVYRTIPFELDPLDFEAFLANPCEFYAAVTNCETGEAEYKRVRDYDADSEIVRASSSLPLLARMVELNGGLYLDGGITDSIPLERALEDGYERCVVVLTQPEGYVKKCNALMPLLRLRYRKYPALLRALEVRHIRYNSALALIEAEEREGRALVIRPAAPLGIGRTEKNIAKLDAGYKLGLETGLAAAGKLRHFLA